MKQQSCSVIENKKNKDDIGRSKRIVTNKSYITMNHSEVELNDIDKIFIFSQTSSPSSFLTSCYDSEPPFLAIGTDVSAKYKGAFCEAKIKNITRLVKCRVTFKNNCGSVIVTDDNVKGPLRVGAHIEAKHPDKNQFLEGIINKIIDASQYTVVFDDGDETTLRRTSLCLKSGKHFAESESLDHLPLTNPEHFGNPVNLGIRGRRRRKRVPGMSTHTYSSTMSDADDNESAEGDGLPSGSIDDDDSASNLTQQSGSVGNPKDDAEEIRRDPDWGRVVCVEYGDKRGNKTKDVWFPALIVCPAAQESNSKLDEKEEYLVKSFINGRYYQVVKKDVKDLTKKVANNLLSDNSTSASLKAGLEKALCYIEKDDLPFNWDQETLLGNAPGSSKSEDVGNMSSEFESVEEEDDDENEPSEEKDRFVAQLYKYMDERGTPLNKPPSVGGKDLDLYKLYRIVAKAGGYNRVTNRNIWRKIYFKMNLPNVDSISSANEQQINQLKGAYKKFLLSFDDFYRKLGCTMVNHTLTSRSSGRLARSERNWKGSCSEKEKDIAPAKSRRKKGAGEIQKKEEISNCSLQNDDKLFTAGEDEEKSGPPVQRKGKRRGKFGRKRGPKSVTDGDESVAGDSYDRGVNIDSETESDTEYDVKMPTISKDVVVNIDDRIRVKYGKGKGMKIYEAKVLKSNNDADLSKRKYFVHYTGWNVRYDEWIKRNRIVELVRDKITRRKGGKMRNRGQSVIGDASLKCEETSEVNGKEPKEIKEKPPAKRGRPAADKSDKFGNKKENKNLPVSKRRSKTDSFRREIKEGNGSTFSKPAEEDRPKESKKENQMTSGLTDDLDIDEKQRKNLKENVNDLKQDKEDHEESTDLDILEASINSNSVLIKEENILALKENVYDILVCDENLEKSPLPRVTSDFSNEAIKKEEIQEKELKESEFQKQGKSANEQNSDRPKVFKRKRISKLFKEEEKKRSEDEEEEISKNQELPTSLKRKKIRKIKEDANDEENKRIVKGMKKKRKSSSLDTREADSNVSDEREGMKKRKRYYFGKKRNTDISPKVASPVTESKSKEIVGVKKRMKREQEDKFKPIKEPLEQNNDESTVVIDTGANQNFAEKGEESLIDPLSNEAGGSFLLCKEEVPASPVHRSEMVDKIEKLPSGECSSENNESELLPPSSALSNSHLSFGNSTRCVANSESEKLSRVPTPPANECPQFTPPTTPESLKSGTLSSSTPPHERESDGEKNQVLSITHERMFHSEIDVSKVNLSSSMNALDNLASVASVAPVKSMSSPPPTSDDSCSRNVTGDFNKKDKNSMLTSPLCSPKKKRKGRVRTSSTSESIKDEKVKNSVIGTSSIGCKTRSSFGRKTRQHHDINIDPHLISESACSVPCSFPAISLSNYSPNGFVYSVTPTSKYNFCTPIDESLEAEKRIHILQERLSDLRKTYLNIKAEVASIERRRKKAKKRDKEQETSSPNNNCKESCDNEKNGYDEGRETILGSKTESSG